MREVQDEGRSGAAAGASGGYAPSESSSGSGRGDREERSARYREDRRGERLEERDSGRRGTGAGAGYYARDEVLMRDRDVGTGRSRSRMRERSRERDDTYDGYRGPSRDRSDAVGPAGVVDRRSNPRRELDYYPPSPQRLTVDRGGSTRGSSRDRSRPVRYDDDEPEVVFVRREPAPGGARYSVEAAPVDVGRPRSRYDSYR
jgi:hypothetical protein